MRARQTSRGNACTLCFPRQRPNQPNTLATNYSRNLHQSTAKLWWVNLHFFSFNPRSRLSSFSLIFLRFFQLGCGGDFLFVEFKCFDVFQLYFVENFPFCGKNFHLNVSRRQCCCTPLSGPESGPEVEEKKQIDTRHLIHCPRFNLRNPYRTFCFDWRKEFPTSRLPLMGR